MKKVTSISGGKTSAYLAANYPTEYNVFSLVRTDDTNCKWNGDKKIIQEVEDRIQKPFIGTLEDDKIIYTILDLEQFIGKKIEWVTGETFDHVIKYKGGWLPNKLHRYCTTNLKLKPIFYWWAETISEPCIFQIGFRADEPSRVKKHLSRCNENGLLEFKASFEKHKEGRHKGNNKWELVEWQKPEYPLFEDQVLKWEILNFWESKNIRFADYNNCVGCFHRKPAFLKKMHKNHANKIEWFIGKEGGPNGYWRSDISYKKAIEQEYTLSLFEEENIACETGYCGI